MKNNIKTEKKPSTIKIDFKKLFTTKNSITNNAMVALIATFIVITIMACSLTTEYTNMSKGLASIAVCALGAISMKITKGETGIGWAIFGLIIIW